MNVLQPQSRKTKTVEEVEEPPSSAHGSAKILDFNTPTSHTNTSRNRIFVRASEHSRAFLRHFYRGTSLSEWNDWRWQLKNRLRTAEQLARVLDLSGSELAALSRHRGSLPLGITPYYASLLDADDAGHPLRRCVVPVSSEFVRSPGEAVDPLGEESHMVVPGLVHRYPDRVLFLATGFCSVYCRYCTRSRMVGNSSGQSFSRRHWEQAIAYIEAHTEVRDVLISGGDPLGMREEMLQWILTRLRGIKHVELIRIGTKAPAVLPQRITPSLTKVLKQHHPLWMSIHFTHPEELTPEVAEACGKLADAGIPLGSQTVLLKGINDNVETLKALFQGLVKIRVRPYYLYQCDPITGSAHFRTPVEKGLEIMRGLRGFTTGYAVPTYVIDAPQGGGKVPLLPEYYLGREGNDVLLSNYEGKVFRYPDPVEEDKA